VDYGLPVVLTAMKIGIEIVTRRIAQKTTGERFYIAGFNTAELGALSAKRHPVWEK
jgi:hypothetical protein